MVERPPNSLYLLGNIETGKSEKKLQSFSDSTCALTAYKTWQLTKLIRTSRALRRNSARTPLTYIRNIETGKSKKKL